MNFITELHKLRVCGIFGLEGMLNQWFAAPQGGPNQSGASHLHCIGYVFLGCSSDPHVKDMQILKGKYTLGAGVEP